MCWSFCWLVCCYVLEFLFVVKIAQFVLLLMAVAGILLLFKQESPAVADKPARRESMPKIAPIRCAYNVVADNTGLSSFIWLLLHPKS